MARPGASHVVVLWLMLQVKRIFLEGNPYLLALTMAVSMLHSVFDFLAFKNDIGFWRDNKSMEGLSARSIVINAFCQLVSAAAQRTTHSVAY